MIDAFLLATSIFSFFAKAFFILFNSSYSFSFGLISSIFAISNFANSFKSSRFFSSSFILDNLFSISINSLYLLSKSILIFLNSGKFLFAYLSKNSIKVSLLKSLVSLRLKYFIKLFDISLKVFFDKD